MWRRVEHDPFAKVGKETIFFGAFKLVSSEISLSNKLRIARFTPTVKREKRVKLQPWRKLRVSPTLPLTRPLNRSRVVDHKCLFRCNHLTAFVYALSLFEKIDFYCRFIKLPSRPFPNACIKLMNV